MRQVPEGLHVEPVAARQGGARKDRSRRVLIGRQKGPPIGTAHLAVDKVGDLN